MTSVELVKMLRRVMLALIVLLATLVVGSKCAHADVNPLGTYTVGSGSSCGNLPHVPDQCINVTVSCPGVPSLVARLRVTNANVSPATGTILFFTGGGGNGFWSAAYQTYGVTNILEASQLAGYRRLEVAWTSSMLSGGAGAIAAFCRPATLMKAVFETTSGTYKLHDAGTMLIATGNSGGGSEVMYPLMRFGAGIWLDCAIPTSGPAISSYTRGCSGGPIPSLDPTWAATCSTYTTTHYAWTQCGYSDTEASAFVDPMWGGNQCLLHTGSGSRNYLKEGLDSPASTRIFPNTTVSGFYGNEDTSGAVPNARFIMSLLPQATTTIATCSDAPNCHALPNDPTASVTIRNAILACTYRH